MASGIKITKADYGAGSKTVDVRSAVSQNIKDGELNLVVGADSLGISDPAPGQTKQLTLSYTINNGDTNTKSAYDNEVIRISAPSQKVASGLDITKAEYGYPGNMTNVTDAVRKYVKDGNISLKVSPSTVGIPDPNPNKQKYLEVEYTLNGSKNTGTFKDGETFSISAPSAQNTPEGPTAGEVVGKIVLWIIVSTLYFIGIFAGYKYGLLFNQWVAYFFAVLCLIPLLGFQFLCLFAMGYALYCGTKMDMFQNVIIPFRSTPTIPV